MSRDRAPSVHSLATPLLLFVAIGTLGCYANPAPGAHADDAPLDAWLPSGLEIEQSQFTLFRINKPAHVAIFDIRPGEGVRALYPWSPGSARRLLSSGYHVVPGLNEGVGCRPLGASPIAYRFIVASEEPLQLEELRGDVGFRYVPGIRSRFFASGSPVRAMEAIVAGAAPEAPSAPENADLAAYYSQYWVPTCGPAVPTRITRVLALQRDRGADVESPSDDGRVAPEDVPDIHVPRNPGDHRVRSPAAEEETIVTSGRLADVVSEAANSSLPETLRERLGPRVRSGDAGRGFRGFDRRLPHAGGFDRSWSGRSASSSAGQSDGIRNTDRSDARPPARRPNPSSEVKPDVQSDPDDGAS